MNKGRLSKHVSIKDDNWAKSSKKKLKASMEHKAKRIYVGLLDLLDKEKLSGRMSDETCSELRSRILNIGNDQIRNMKKEIDDRYNVEFIPYHMEFKVSPIEGIDPIVGG
jgi:anaerobic ribonucleoside-triphosphate reductase